MRIIHISDFHYIPKARSEFERVVEELVKSVSQQAPVDLVVFSGDLIYKDASIEQFNEAANCLFDPLLKASHLDKSRLLICPGNHDLLRNAEMSMVADSLNSKTQSKDLDAFCDDSDQLSLSLTRFKAYNQFVSDYFGDCLDIQPLYTTAKREINGKSVGLLSFNSAWRSIESDRDRGNLLFPIRYIHEAIEKVRKCDLVLCAMHHAVSDFKDYIEQEIENSVFEDCHILFTGHYHKAKLSSILSTNGLLHSVGYATFNYNDKASTYGYMIITIDEESFEVKIEAFPFVTNHFVADEPISTVLPMSVDKRASNEFRRVMRKQLTYFREKADNLFVKGRTNETAGHTFSMLFSEPVIKDKSLQELLASGKKGTKIPLLQIEDSSRPTILFGRNKSGRTSLLYKVMIDYLFSYASRKVIPYYVACKELSGDSLNLERRLRDFLSLSKADLKKRFESYQLVLLLDDLELNDASFLANLKEEIAPFVNVRFIATTEETLTNQCALMYFEDVDIDNYYIHDVTPREVHQLTTRWPNMPAANKQRYEEKIVKILQQMHMPFNYWTISLFLWIFEKTDASNIHNNFELINLYIDEILDKKSLITDKSFKIDYEDLKSYLAALSEFLLSKKNHRISYKELVDFTEGYRKTHQKFVEQTRDIIELLIRRGVLVEEEQSSGGNGNQNLYTFRLNGVFEYFVALRFSDNTELKDKVLADGSTFFSFGTELELYAGFKKDDIDAIENIFKKTQGILSPLSDKKGYGDIDGRLVQEIIVDPTIGARVTGDLFERVSEMSKEEADNLLPIPSVPINESRVVQKVYLTEIHPTPANIEKALFILSRVYRNSNACDHEELSEQILNFVLTGVCNLGFMLSDETKHLAKTEGDYKDIIQLMNNFMPIIIQSFLYDAICQQNLVRVFDSKLKELRDNPNGNEFRIFVLSFILVDLNPSANIHYIEDSMPYIKNRLLRFAIINKLMLLMLSNAEDKTLVCKLNAIASPVMKEFKDYKFSQDRIMKAVEASSMKNRMIKTGESKDYQ